MFSEKFEKDLEIVDSLLEDISVMFDEKEVSPLVAIVVCDQLKRMSQGGFEQWMGIYQNFKSNKEKVELTEVREEEKEV